MNKKNCLVYFLAYCCLSVGAVFGATTVVTSNDYGVALVGSTNPAVFFPWTTITNPLKGYLKLQFTATTKSDLSIGFKVSSTASAYLEIVAGSANNTGSVVRYYPYGRNLTPIYTETIPVGPGTGTGVISPGVATLYTLTINGGAISLIGTPVGGGVSTTIISYLPANSSIVPFIYNSTFTVYSFRTNNTSTYVNSLTVSDDVVIPLPALPAGALTSNDYASAVAGYWPTEQSKFYGWKTIAPTSGALQLSFVANVFYGNLMVALQHSTGFVELNIGGFRNTKSGLRTYPTTYTTAYLTNELISSTVANPGVITPGVDIFYTVSVENGTITVTATPVAGGATVTLVSYSSANLNKTFTGYSFRTNNTSFATSNPASNYINYVIVSNVMCGATTSNMYAVASPAGSAAFPWKPVAGLTNTTNALTLSFTSTTIGGDLDIGIGYIPAGTTSGIGSPQPVTYIDLIVGGANNTASRITYYEGDNPSVLLMPGGESGGTANLTLDVAIKYTLTISNGTLLLVGTDLNGVSTTILNYASKDLLKKNFTHYSFRTSNDIIPTRGSAISADSATAKLVLPPGSYTSNDFSTVMPGYFSAADTNFFGWKPIPSALQGNPIQLSFTAYTPLTNLTIGLRSGTNSVVATYIGGWFNAQSAIAEFPNGTASPGFNPNGGSDPFQYIYPGGSNGTAVFPKEPTKYVMTVMGDMVKIVGTPVAGGASSLVLFYITPSLNKVFNAYSFCTWNAPDNFNYITVTDDSIAAASQDVVITSNNYDSSYSPIISPATFFGWKPFSAASNCFSIEFNAFTKSDLHIGLQYNNGTSFIEFVIGGWSNTLSAFRVFNNNAQQGSDVYIQPVGTGKVIPDTDNYVSYVATMGVNPATGKGFFSISGTTLAGAASKVFYYESSYLNQNFSGYSFRTYSSYDWRNSLYLSSVTATVDLVASAAASLNVALMQAKAAIDPVIALVSQASAKLTAAQQVYKTIATNLSGVTLPF